MAKKNATYSVSCDTFVLVPNDERDFWDNFLMTRGVKVLSGSLTNVLDRYLLLSEYDYVIRLTSDCPNVPPMTINKAVFTAIHHEIDYLSNAWEKYRTAIDGHDVEILSQKALCWLKDNALDQYDQEHVTPAIRTKKHGLKCGALINKEDLSHIKLCIDTSDEFDACSERFNSSYRKKIEAERNGITVYEY